MLVLRFGSPLRSPARGLCEARDSRVRGGPRRLRRLGESGACRSPIQKLVLRFGKSGTDFRTVVLGSVFKSLWGADLFFDSVSASHELEIQGVFRRSRAAPTKPKPGVITPNGF